MLKELARHPNASSQLFVNISAGTEGEKIAGFKGLAQGAGLGAFTCQFAAYPKFYSEIYEGSERCSMAFLTESLRTCKHDGGTGRHENHFLFGLPLGNALHHKCFSLLCPFDGHVLRIETPGGGGHGSPPG